jgi:hypothetical protein
MSESPVDGSNPAPIPAANQGIVAKVLQKIISAKSE